MGTVKQVTVSPGLISAVKNTVEKLKIDETQFKALKVLLEELTRDEEQEALFYEALRPLAFKGLPEAAKELAKKYKIEKR